MLENPKIPANLRVMIALVSSPTLLLMAYIIYVLWQGKWSQISIAGVIFSLLGVFAYFIVITGRLPTFSKKAK
ncbi:MAG: hypothetical protein ACI96W_002951 [Paraglaciecola sp.]